MPDRLRNQAHWLAYLYSDKRMSERAREFAFSIACEAARAGGLLQLRPGSELGDEFEPADIDMAIAELAHLGWLAPSVIGEPLKYGGWARLMLPSGKPLRAIEPMSVPEVDAPANE